MPRTLSHSGYTSADAPGVKYFGSPMFCTTSSGVTPRARATARMSSPGATTCDALPTVMVWPAASRLAVAALAAPSEVSVVPSRPARPASVAPPGAAAAADSGTWGGTANTAAFGSARLSVTSAVLWNARSGMVERASPGAGNAVTSRLTVAVGSWLKISAGRPWPSWLAR